MANWNRLAVAAGLAGALAVFGQAWAQTGPGAAAAPGAPGTGTSSTTDQSAGAPRDSGRSMSDSNKPSATDPSTTNSTSTGSSDQTAAGSASSSDMAAGMSAKGAKASGKVDKKLQEDIQKIHAANQAEVHMGQMGAQQASSPEVKEFAQKLEQDHQKLDDKLTQVAQSAGVQLEGKGYQSEQKDAEKTMKKLQGKSGQDFDKEFVSMMVKDHEKDIKVTEKAAKEAKKQHQTELASLLDQAVTGMKGHLSTAKQLKETVGKNKSAHGSTSGSSSTGMGAGSTGGSSSMGSTGDSSSKDNTTGGSSSTGAGSSTGSSHGDTGSTSDTTTKKPDSGK